MHITCRNVNDAYKDVFELVRDQGVVEKTRGGRVKTLPNPISVATVLPQERVLIDKERDANPFFHLYEAMWMLAGRNDLKSLQWYNSRMSEFSSDGETFHGAYGHRWRHHFDTDQLRDLLQRIEADPHSRRHVLVMYDVADGVAADSGEVDIPCNTHIYFRVIHNSLNMTVCNRSNDLVWGMLGANYVHFSILLEWMAVQLNLAVGAMVQFTNNLHIYERHWELTPSGENCAYISNVHRVVPDFTLSQAEDFVDEPCGLGGTESQFIETVLAPMMNAFEAYKYKSWEAAYAYLNAVMDADWRRAGHDWIKRRETKHTLGNPYAELS